MKTIRLSLAVAADKLADVVDMLHEMNIVPTLSASGTETATADDDDEIVQQPAKPRKVAAATMSASVPTAAKRTGGNRGPVVYTPAKTAKQIAATLDGLRKNTVGAFVLSDIAKHPGTSKRDMLKRLEPKLVKHELSVGSVDNAVWLLQNKGIVKSVAVEE